MQNNPTTDFLQLTDKCELNERQKNVLREICDAFISTGTPVGSRTLSRSASLSCSPATIRNEMSDLESMGYVYSPHTSAGRVPTEKGYKFYVNFLINCERVGVLEEAVIEKIACVSRKNHLKQQDILKSAVKYAVEQTNLPGVLLAPRKSKSRLKYIKLVRVLEDKAMLLTVDINGNINDQIVSIPHETTDDIIEKLSILLNAQLCNDNKQMFELEYINSTKNLISKYNNLLSQLVSKVKDSMADPDDNTLFFEGFVNFFNQPEFREAEKIKQLVCLLEQKETLLNILAESLDDKGEIMVNIGSESGLAIKDLSVVTAKYRGPGKSLGKIGLIGPLRMDYSRVVATLAKLSHTLSKILIGEGQFSESTDGTDELLSTSENKTKVKFSND